MDFQFIRQGTRYSVHTEVGNGTAKVDVSAICSVVDTGADCELTMTWPLDGDLAAEAQRILTGGEHLL